MSDFAGTNERRPLDDAVVLEIGKRTLESIRGGLNVDTTADIADGRERRIVKGTCPIDRATDAFNVVKPSDILKGRVVRDKEGPTNVGELRKRRVC